MVFNDSTNKNGIIQECEFWTNLGDGQISGDATLLKIFTARVNAGFDRLMPFLLSFGSYLKWDDANQTDLPVGKFNIVSGQSDYTIAQDANGLDILNITNVQILPNATSTYYMDLEVISMDDRRAKWAMSPATTDIGTPTCVLKRGNSLFFFPQFNYNATNGVKIFFERDPSYFASSDTTKAPGVPKPFHALLPLYASYDWILVNKPGETELISRIESNIARKEKDFNAAIKGRFPTRESVTSEYIAHR